MIYTHEDSDTQRTYEIIWSWLGFAFLEPVLIKAKNESTARHLWHKLYWKPEYEINEVRDVTELYGD